MGRAVGWTYAGHPACLVPTAAASLAGRTRARHGVLKSCSCRPRCHRAVATRAGSSMGCNGSKAAGAKKPDAAAADDGDTHSEAEQRVRICGRRRGALGHHAQEPNIPCGESLTSMINCRFWFSEDASMMHLCPFGSVHITQDTNTTGHSNNMIEQV